MYNTIPIQVINSWDRFIDAYFNNGTRLNIPHRAILTTKQNIQIGVEEERSMTEFDIFMDKKTKKWYLDSLFKLDAKIIEDYMIQVAY